MHIESGAAPGLGLPGALGEQAHWHCRSERTGPLADEPTQRARLTDVAGLSVASAKVGALIVQGILGAHKGEPIRKIIASLAQQRRPNSRRCPATFLFCCHPLSGLVLSES